MTILVDDATKPEDNSLTYPASEGAGEFRALKAKVNSLFLNTGVGASFAKLIDTNNSGLNAAISDNSVADLYSSKFKITRTANAAAKNTYGVYCESVFNNSISVTTGSINALAAIVQMGTSCTIGSIYCLNSVIYQQTHTFNGTLAGLYLVFSDRLTAGAAAPSGLGSNQYNRDANAILIDAFPRSSSGEFCGWKTGIKFTPTSMDQDIIGRGYCIDTSQLTLTLTADPRTCYQAKAMLKLRDMQCIIWDIGDNICTYFDATLGRWVIWNNGAERFGVDVATGAIYKNGVAVL